MLIATKNDLSLGELKFGKPHNFTYTIENQSDSDVTISKLQIGCTACTSATIDKYSLKPKEKAVVSVIFTPGSTGIQSKRITVKSSSKDLELKFKATVNE